MTRGRQLRALALLGCGSAVACSLVVDTSDLANGPKPAISNDSGGAVDSAPAPAITDAGAEADAPRVFPAAATVWPSNGHAYEVVHATGVTWRGAKDGAEQHGGHLVTLTTSEENDFVWSLVVAFQPSVVDENNYGPWIGGVQQTGNQPLEGWGWVDGEPWSFTLWHSNEPGDYGGGDETALGYFEGPFWGDYPDDQSFGVGYVVEYEP